jgi:hypothetical protein
LTCAASCAVMDEALGSRGWEMGRYVTLVAVGSSFPLSFFMRAVIFR